MSHTLREVNHTMTGVQTLEFEAMNYSVGPQDPTRADAQESDAFATMQEANDYALECANKDRGHFYHVRRLGFQSQIVSSVRIAKE